MLCSNLRIPAVLAFAVWAASPLLADLNPEFGAFLIQKFSAKDYGASQQNWAMVQDSRGVMYVANNDGVLEFDGVSWRQIPLTVHSQVRALAIDTLGTIFVGARGIFGYLAPAPDGTLHFVSLLDKVPVTDRTFNDVWDVLPTSDGVYFASHRRLFLYTPSGVLKVFQPSGDFGRAFVYHDELFITSGSEGLLTMKSRQLTRSNIAGEASKLTAGVMFANGSTPLLAANERLYRFTLGSIDLLTTAADQYFRDYAIHAVHELANGDVLVGTERGGVVWLNSAGRIQRIIRKTDGLLSNFISGIYRGRDNAIWLSTDSGLMRFPLWLSSFGELQGLHGNVYAIARLGGVIYAGTSSGLFRMKIALGSEPVFTPVKGIQDQVFAIVEHNGVFLVGGDRGLYVITNGAIQYIGSKSVVFDIGLSRKDQDTIYTAGGDGIQMVRLRGKTWSVQRREHGPGQDFRTAVEAPDGTLWGTTERAVWRIDFSSQPAKMEQFTEQNGVPGGFNNAYLFRGHVVVASTRGLIQFSPQANRFEPDPELGRQFSDGQLAVSIVHQDQGGDIWITGKGYHGLLQGNQWIRDPMIETGIDEIFDMHTDPDRTTWAAGVSGTLFRYEKPAVRRDSKFQVLIRSAMLTNENKSIFGGYGAVPPTTLPYKNNALRFEYAAPFMEKQQGVQYQYRLEGSEKNWSEWTNETRKDYTNLSEGSYTFQVRAQNPHGVQSAPAVFKFSLMPPWYRTWWAYTIYVSGVLFAGWLILRWRLQALEARNKWLEGVVEERTAEVRSERDQNEALLLNILPKPVASELRETGSVKPTSFEDVTVCFSDFVGFTLSSEKVPPQELITSLNEYFTAFDEIIGRYGLEKLKTIGDAYMFAGGLPSASPSHAVDAVLAALEMVQVVRRLARPDKGMNWSIRLGLYSGPVVAGVVGVRKFAFDIWGNTVNFAARMESAGSANRVNLSETTEARVLDFIECEPRGQIRIKEGREMEMYFAVGLKPELLTGPLIDGIPQAFRAKYEQAFSKPPKTFPNLNGRHAE